MHWGPALFPLYQAQSFIGTPPPFMAPLSQPTLTPTGPASPRPCWVRSGRGKVSSKRHVLSCPGAQVIHPLNSPAGASQPSYGGGISPPLFRMRKLRSRVPGTPISHAHECTMELGALSLDTGVDADEAENLGLLVCSLVKAALPPASDESCLLWLEGAPTPSPEGTPLTGFCSIIPVAFSPRTRV